MKIKKMVSLLGVGAIGISSAIGLSNCNEPTPPTPPVTPGTPTLVPTIEKVNDGLKIGTDNFDKLWIEETNVDTWVEPVIVPGDSGLLIGSIFEQGTSPLKKYVKINIGWAVAGNYSIKIIAQGFGEQVTNVNVMPPNGDAISANITGFLQIDVESQIDIQVEKYGNASDKIREITGEAINEGKLTATFSQQSNVATINIGSNRPDPGFYDLTIKSMTGDATQIELYVLAAPLNPIPIGGNYALWSDVKQYFDYSGGTNIGSQGIKYPSDLNTFMSTWGFDGIDFGNNISSIGDNAFKRGGSPMQKNGTVQFLKFTNIENVGDHAFENCTGLKQVYLGDGTNSSTHQISIGDSAFSGCSNLEYFGVANDARFSKIGSYAFASCSNLTNRDFFYVTNDNLNEKGTWINSNDGKGAWVKDPVSNKALGCIAFGEIEYDLNGGNTTVQDAFKYCHGLKSVKIINTGNAVQIMANSFSDCNNLVNVEIPNIRIISQYAFANCSNLTSIEFNDDSSVSLDSSTIMEHAFEKCSKLQIINLPHRISAIDSSAFYQCSNLQDFKFYEDGSTTNFLTCNIGSNAFNGCVKLSLIEITNKMNGDIDENAFANMEEAKNGAIVSISDKTPFANSLVSHLPGTGQYAWKIFAIHN